jgi:hypothetical protein
MQNQLNGIKKSPETSQNRCGKLLNDKGYSNLGGKDDSLVNKVGSATYYLGNK